MTGDRRFIAYICEETHEIQAILKTFEKENCIIFNGKTKPHKNLHITIQPPKIQSLEKAKAKLEQIYGMTKHPTLITVTGYKKWANQNKLYLEGEFDLYPNTIPKIQNPHFTILEALEGYENKIYYDFKERVDESKIEGLTIPIKSLAIIRKDHGVEYEIPLNSEASKNFNEDDVRFTYRLLGHKEETEIRLIDPTKKKSPKSVFVHNEDEFIKVCKEHNGKYNVYAGINERRTGGTTGTDVKTINVFVIDIDAIRKDSKLTTEELKKLSATDLELKKAEEVANKIVKDLAKKGHRTYKACSGNGYQLWISLIPMKASEELEAKIQILQRETRKRYENEEVGIDNIGDLPRIIKVIGSLNIKGDNTEDRPHRLSQWDVSIKKVVRCSKTAERIKNIEIPPTPEIKEFNFDELSDGELRQVIENDILIWDLMNGKWEDYDYKSRSEAEFALVIKLIQKKAPHKQVVELMERCKIGKWLEANDRYRELTYRKALGFAQKNPLKMKVNIVKLSGFR